MKGGLPVSKDLVLVGGGHAHAGVLRAWGMRPEPGVRVRLVSPSDLAPYSGMLPGHVAGHYSDSEVHLDLRRLCRWAGVEFIRARVVGLDPEGRQVLLDGRPPLTFDVVSINTGSTPSMKGVPGAAEHSIPVKPVEAFLPRWDAVRARWRACHGGVFRLVTVGGGAGGVELLLAARHRLIAEARAEGRDESGLECHLVSAAAVVPAGYPAPVCRRVALELARRGVRIHAGTRASEVGPGEIRFEDGGRLGFEALFWTTQAGAPGWLAASGLATDAGGFLEVNECLQSTSHPRVFGAGDVASVTPHRRAKSGVFAVRQGRPLSENLRRQLRGESLVPFRPQRRFLSLISLGDRSAVASRGRLACSGNWVWRWKDWIDRRWMRSHQELGPMPSSQGPTPAMRCGGCGAKVGPEILQRVLRRLAPIPARAESIVGLEAPDDAAVTRIPDGQALVESVDLLRDFTGDPYWLGRIAANHALGDLHAMGVQPRTAQAIATVPWGSATVMEETLFQLLSGALETLRAESVALVGGHSSEGAELALGLAVQGWTTPDQVLRKSGLVPGQALVLTKALGTGVVLAAAASGLRLGTRYDQALAGMLVSQGPAARCLRRHGATACTDVTGFGFIGHLLEMLDASGVAARVDWDVVPKLEGALVGLGAGFRSSLHPENRRRADRVEVVGLAGRETELELAYDPQTAGGLLAGVPWEAATRCVAELKTLGYAEAVLVGRVESRTEAAKAVRLEAGGGPGRGA